MIADRLELYSGAAAVALVEGLTIRDRIEDARTSIQVRIDAVAEQGDSWEMPELLRVRGELRARSGDLAGAEQDLHAAMELAEQQSALSWRLRIAASRARLAIEPEAKEGAVSDLKRIHACFAEGFETADLRHAHEIVQVFG
jgi:predicted ATPase